MEEKRWKEVRTIIRQLARRKSSREVFGDADIAEVFYWSVVHDRPQGWATFRESWPIHLRRGRRLPSQGTLSRRIATRRIVELFSSPRFRGRPASKASTPSLPRWETVDDQQDFEGSTVGLRVGRWRDGKGLQDPCFTRWKPFHRLMEIVSAVDQREDHGATDDQSDSASRLRCGRRQLR